MTYDRHTIVIGGCSMCVDKTCVELVGRGINVRLMREKRNRVRGLIKLHNVLFNVGNVELRWLLNAMRAINAMYIKNNACRASKHALFGNMQINVCLNATTFNVNDRLLKIDGRMYAAFVAAIIQFYK